MIQLGAMTAIYRIWLYKPMDNEWSSLFLCPPIIFTILQSTSTLPVLVQLGRKARQEESCLTEEEC